jgi:hypothetical protein
MSKRFFVSPRGFAWQGRRPTEEQVEHVDSAVFLDLPERIEDGIAENNYYATYANWLDDNMVQLRAMDRQVANAVQEDFDDSPDDSPYY